MRASSLFSSIPFYPRPEWVACCPDRTAGKRRDTEERALSLSHRNETFSDRVRPAPFAGMTVPFLEQLVANVSVLTIMAISMERYYAICKPLRAGYTWTKMRALVVIVVVWLTAIITSR